MVITIKLKDFVLVLTRKEQRMAAQQPYWGVQGGRQFRGGEGIEIQPFVFKDTLKMI